MSGISLTSSMRNNLLSLQQTAKLQDLTQNRLATGLKVNSAIDNPSSYYTAQSLNNRADDLNILLDAMSQGIQTLKAVNESLEAGTKFLEQAKSVANTALETALPIAAKVSTEAELLAAVNSGKQGLIVLTSDITMSTNQNIVLNDGQSLVGARYLDPNAAQAKLSFNFVGDNNPDALTLGNNSLLSDLDIRADYEMLPKVGLIAGENVQNIHLRNLNLSFDTQGAANTEWPSAIHLAHSTTGKISGTINMDVKGRYTRGLAVYFSSVLDTGEDLSLNIKTDGFQAHGIVVAYQNAEFNLNAGSKVTAKTTGAALSTHEGISNIKSGAQFYLHNADFFNGGASVAPVVNISAGAVIGFKTAADTKIYQNDSDFTFSGNGLLSISNYAALSGAAEKAGAVFPDIDDEMAKPMPPTEEKTDEKTEQFNQILTQYDQLINDSWYKGVNLLKGQDLKVIFNESRTAGLDIEGVDASAEGLGLESASWGNAEDVQKSLEQLDTAVNQLRLYASEFGNYYQIVTTRENFTNSLINVLTEGADALTLADMNQESANMLALQTRQQLAVNSLSLASQASQSVLKLF